MKTNFGFQLSQWGFLELILKAGDVFSGTSTKRKKKKIYLICDFWIGCQGFLAYWVVKLACCSASTEFELPFWYEILKWSRKDLSYFFPNLFYQFLVLGSWWCPNQEGLQTESILIIKVTWVAFTQEIQEKQKLNRVKEAELPNLWDNTGMKLMSWFFSYPGLSCLFWWWDLWYFSTADACGFRGKRGEQGVLFGNCYGFVCIKVVSPRGSNQEYRQGVLSTLSTHLPRGSVRCRHREVP